MIPRPILFILFCYLTGASVFSLENDTTSSAAHSSSLPWMELGEEVAKQYSGKGLSIEASADGNAYLLSCRSQSLQGELTDLGLWLSSGSGKISEERFRVMSSSLGRSDGSSFDLADSGVAEIGDGFAVWKRPSLTEQFFVGVDGIRQDFIVSERPAGEGALIVELRVDGAAFEVEEVRHGHRLHKNRGHRLHLYHLVLCLGFL